MFPLILLICFVKKHSRAAYLTVEGYVQNPGKHPVNIQKHPEPGNIENIQNPKTSKTRENIIVALMNPNISILDVLLDSEYASVTIREANVL